MSKQLTCDHIVVLMWSHFCIDVSNCIQRKDLYGTRLLVSLIFAMQTNTEAFRMGKNTDRQSRQAYSYVNSVVS
jgi:hypothetical protein